MPVEVDPIEGILAVLEEGSATGTNKFALLLALIDLAPGLGSDGVLDVREISAKLIELHWEHAWDYGGEGGPVLRQVTSRNRVNTTAVLEVQRLRALLIGSIGSGVGEPPFEVAQPLLDTAEWDRSVSRLARDTKRNPLAKLQTINRQQVPFLYESVEGNKVRLLPTAINVLVRFGPVLRDLIEFRFVRFVVAANRVGLGPSIEEQVAQHLFDLERHMPPAPMRRDLWELQGRRCPYTHGPVGDPLRVVGSSLDHVVPWSRTRVSVIENFVVTTRSVNSTKSNLLLAPPLLQNWSRHVIDNADELRDIAGRYGWPTDVSRIARVLAAVYRRASPALGVWAGQGEVVVLGEEGKVEVLAALEQLTPGLT